MVKKLLLALGALMLLACAGAAYSHSRGMALPLVGAKPIADVIALPVASGDSIVVAEFARERCRWMAGAARAPCYEEIFLTMVRDNHVRLAMDALSVLSRLDPDLPRRGHDYTHVVGINAWSPGEDVGGVYESCTGLFQSGCYHGVVQAYLDAMGTDSTTVYGLCNQIQVAVFDMWLRFQCVHGIGHGLVNATAMHLPKALAGCDWLVDSWDAQSCYGGAFMEFIVAGRGQSHHHKKAAPAAAEADHADHPGTPPAAPPPAAAHGAPGHDHATMATADTFAVRDRSDPLYPCSVLDTKYQVACYMMQAGIIIEIVGADWGKISHACDDAPVAMQPACYQGVGTYVSGYTVRDADKSIEHCSKGDEKLQVWCYVGVTKNFVDVTANADDALDFCRRLTNHDYAVGCYHAIGEEMGVLYRDAAQRETQCARAPRDYVEACRYGAVLPAARPRELTPFSPTG